MRGIGRAGNPSPTVDYAFFAGPGAAAHPGAGERTARRVALNAEGKTEHTKVEYQYRLATTDPWVPVPVANVRTTSGGKVTWPVAAAKGHPQPLVWTVADTLAEDGPVHVRAHFTGGKATHTDPHRIVLDRDAGTAPQPSIGPGSVNLLTGAYSHTATDAAAWGVSAQRTTISDVMWSAQLGLAAIYGPGWAPGSVAETTGSAFVSIRKTSNSSVQVMFADGDGIGFSRTSSGWQPETGSEDLTLSGSESAGFTLTDTAGVKRPSRSRAPRSLPGCCPRVSWQ